MGEAEALDKPWLVGRGGGREYMEMGNTANFTTCLPTATMMTPP